MSHLRSPNAATGMAKHSLPAHVRVHLLSRDMHAGPEEPCQGRPRCPVLGAQPSSVGSSQVCLGRRACSCRGSKLSCFGVSPHEAIRICPKNHQHPPSPPCLPRAWPQVSQGSCLLSLQDPSCLCYPEHFNGFKKHMLRTLSGVNLVWVIHILGGSGTCRTSVVTLLLL